MVADEHDIPIRDKGEVCTTCEHNPGSDFEWVEGISIVVKDKKLAVKISGLVKPLNGVCNKWEAK